jgi:hypothetical protein
MKDKYYITIEKVSDASGWSITRWRNNHGWQIDNIKASKKEIIVFVKGLIKFYAKVGIHYKFKRRKYG